MSKELTLKELEETIAFLKQYTMPINKKLTRERGEPYYLISVPRTRKAKRLVVEIDE